MANTANLRGYLSDVANAIRNITNDNSNIPANSFDMIINNFVLSNEVNLDITPSTQSQNFIPPAGRTGYNVINVLAVTNAIDSNITPQNIVNGVNILGVIGNFEGQVINNQDKVVAPSTSIQNIIADQGYTGLNQVTVNAVNASIDANITPENIANGVNILGVIGNMATSENLEDVIAEQENIIANLSNVINNAAGLPPSEIIFPANTYTSFAACNFTELPSYIGYNTFSLQTNCNYIFRDCKNLTGEINFNMCNAKGTLRTFADCYNISNAHVNMINCTEAHAMFNNCRNLTEINLIMNEPINISFLAHGCTNLITLNLSNAKATAMTSICMNCENLRTISNFDTSNVTHMANAFTNCYNLSSIPEYDISNVTSIESAFRKCFSLVTVPNFNTINVKFMNNAFYSCRNVINIPNFDTSKVMYMDFAFAYCYNLTDVPQLNTSNVYNITQLFAFCNNLTDASVQNIINMCLNSKITNTRMMNVSNMNFFSPFNNTNISRDRYQNRWEELTAAGWTY